MADDDVELPDIQSDEHRRALAARKGRAHGSHIADDSDKEHMAASTDPYALASFLAEMKTRVRDRDPPPPPKTWVSVPVIITMVVGLIGIVGSAATTLQGYTQLGDRLQSFGERMLTLDNRVGLLESTMRDRGRTRDQELSSLTAGNALQDERLQNLTKALEQERQARMEAEADVRRAEADLRAVVGDLTKSVGEIRTDLKVLVDRAERKSSLDVPPGAPPEMASRNLH